MEGNAAVPVPVPVASPSPSPVAGFLGRWLVPHRALLRGSAAASFGAGLATVAQAGAIAWLVDAAVMRGEVPATGVVGLAVLAIALRYALQAWRDRCGQQLARSVRLDVRAGLRERVDALGPLGVAGLGDSGRWASRYQGEVEALAGYYARYLPARNTVLLVPLVTLLAVFWLDWLAALLLLFSAPLIPLFMAMVGMGSERVAASQQREQHRLAGHFLDRLRAIDLLRRSGALDAGTAEVGAASDRYRALSMRVLRVAFLSSAVMEFFSAVAIGLVAIYVGFGLLGSIAFGPAPELTLFTGLFVLLLAPEFFAPLRQFAASYHDRAGALAAAGSLQAAWSADVPEAETSSMPSEASALRSRSPLEAARAEGRHAEVAGGSDASLGPDGAVLRLVQVELAHPRQRQPVLEAVELTLERGEQAVVTGPSGSGKSTLLAACAGFLPPRRGEVERGTSTGHAFAWLGQSAHLFHGSVRSNLAMACPGPATDAALAGALAEAGLPADHAALPDGLDTAIGEGRRGLSGGQAQRVALARALLSDAPLWLVDEPTRGLDPETAEALLDRLLALARSRGVAVLVASHEPAVIGRMPRRLDIVDRRLRGHADG